MYLFMNTSTNSYEKNQRFFWNIFVQWKKDFFLIESLQPALLKLELSYAGYTPFFLFHFYTWDSTEIQWIKKPQNLTTLPFADPLYNLLLLTKYDISIVSKFLQSLGKKKINLPFAP